MNDLPAFVIVDLPGATITIDGQSVGSSVVIRPPTEAELDAMIKADQLEAITLFYNLAGLTFEQASALPIPALDKLVTAISGLIAPILLRQAREALSYNPSEE